MLIQRTKKIIHYCYYWYVCENLIIFTNIYIYTGMTLLPLKFKAFANLHCFAGNTSIC